MPHADEFIEHLLDLLHDLGAVSARRMFGGYGIYRGSVMFGLVSNNTLYLKVDAQNRPLFEAEDLEPFLYESKTRSIEMSYCRAPEAALESPAIMLEWASHALEAARRSGTKAKKKKKASKKAAKKIAKKAAPKNAKKARKKSARR